MIKEMSSLRIKGGFFEEETDLKFFSKTKDGHNNSFSLVFGKNGSGKSTISRGFQKVAGVEDADVDIAELRNVNNDLLEVTEDDKKSIYVFNEEFIENNIRIDSDGLGTIIVMGAVKSVDDQIKVIMDEYVDVKKKQEEKQKLVDKYQDEKDDSSPSYYKNKMREGLKGNDNWAWRDRIIKGNGQNTRVNDDTYKRFIGLSPSKSRNELIVEFDNGLEELKSATNGDKTIKVNVPMLDNFLFDENKIVNLLKEKIEKPVLTDREKNLMNILQEENGLNKLNRIQTYFNVPGNAQCPFCFQTVDKDYAEGLVQSIEKILNKKVKQHQDDLEKVKLLPQEIDFTPFKELSSTKLVECEDNLNKLNSLIGEANSQIARKLMNIFEPIDIADLGLQKQYQKCRKSLSELEVLRAEFNKKAEDTGSIKAKLTKINDEIAHYDIEPFYDKYKEKQAEKKKYEIELLNINQDVKKFEDKLNDLKNEKRNARIAMDSINDDLAYIFFSKNRLRIEYDHDSDKYLLYSNDRPVAPDNVSVGERNAIGLCYFFNRVMENKDEDKVFSKEYLMVIDDPVSSFDMGNRIGILSYLKYKMGKYFRGNDNSKFIMLTHDLQTFYDVKHLMVELICSKHSNMSENKALKYIELLELKNKQVSAMKRYNRGEYTLLMERIFDYGEKINPQESTSIGNVMRKVMEAYGTFVYKKGISELSTDQEILSILNTEKECAYFENLMYRLVLNGDSHMQDKVNTLNDPDFFDYITEEEKQKTAQDIICFLYKLNPLHVKKHLKEKENAEKIIEEWIKSKDV